MSGEESTRVKPVKRRHGFVPQSHKARPPLTLWQISVSRLTDIRQQADSYPSESLLTDIAGWQLSVRKLTVRHQSAGWQLSVKKLNDRHQSAGWQLSVKKLNDRHQSAGWQLSVRKLTDRHQSARLTATDIHQPERLTPTDRHQSADWQLFVRRLMVTVSRLTDIRQQVDSHWQASISRLTAFCRKNEVSVSTRHFLQQTESYFAGRQTLVCRLTELIGRLADIGMQAGRQKSADGHSLNIAPVSSQT